MQILRCCKVLSKSKNVKLIVGFVMLVMFILLDIFHFCVLLLNIIFYHAGQHTQGLIIRNLK